MIDLQKVIEIQQILVEEFGGTHGVRDITLLEAALARPFGGFGETYFYPSAEEKAAALLESIITNHPFLDGNKRIGYVLMRLFLKHYNRDVAASQEEKYDFIISIASGKYDFASIVSWIQNHVFENTGSDMK